MDEVKSKKKKYMGQKYIEKIKEKRQTRVNARKNE